MNIKDTVYPDDRFSFETWFYFSDNPNNFSEWRRYLKEERFKRLKLRNDEYKKSN